MTKKLPGLIFALAVSAFIGAANAPAVQAEANSAKASASREYRIKAAFLYNFAKFTVWPVEAFADAKAPLRLCILGEDRFHGAFKALEGRTVKNRPIVASRPSSTDSLGQCHLLFIGASEHGRLGTILESLRGMPVLAVGDTPRFARSGGIIRLETVDNRVRFEINVEAAHHAKLKLDSRLLRLGRIVGKRAASTTQPPATAEETARLAIISPASGISLEH
ncbi:MAG: YfiR family protein [Proteobacteria bacterium]|nr:YfiR family protein [Pseudomonadota bacterium]MCH8091821.1 YfiR family protein [Pseudomonadota bacterium]